MAYEPPQRDDRDLPQTDEPSDEQFSGRGSETPSLSSVAKTDPSDYSTLPRAYTNALTRAKASTYEAEIPNAGWGKTLLGVAIVTVITFGVKMILAPSGAQSYEYAKEQLAKNGLFADQEPGRSLLQWIKFLNDFSTNPLFALIVPVTFLLGAGLLYIFARMGRDLEETQSGGASFMTHAYLLSLSYTPIRSIAAVLNLFSLLSYVSCLAGIGVLGLFIFQLYSAGLAMQAAHRLEPGRAQVVAFLPAILGILLSIVAVIAVAVIVVLAVRG